jgi:uncharacterized protein YraI
MLRTVITTACICVSGFAWGESRILTGTELKDLVSAGATVELDAPMGYKIPIRYGAEGHMTGEAGGLASYLGAATDTGKWWVKGDELCHKWKQWFSGELKCLRLSRDGRAVQWQDRDGNSGTASIVAMAQKDDRPATPRALAQAIPDATPPPEPQVRALSQLPPPAPKPVRSGAIPNPDAVSPARFETTSAPMPVPPPQKPAAVSTRPADPPPPPAAKTPEQPSAYKVVNIRDDDVLNVRSGPSSEHAVVAALQPGSRGVIITGDCESDWCPVQHPAASGWVNRTFLVSETGFVSAFPPQRASSSIETRSLAAVRGRMAGGDSPEAPRSCLTPAARKLLARVEEKFGPVRLVSTCRPGATIAGTGRPSRHASGNAVDFNAGARKSEILSWLIATHREGGVMTYPDMDHIHIDIGPHFVSIAGGQHWASWHNNVPASGTARSRTVRDDSDEE